MLVSIDKDLVYTPADRKLEAEVASLYRAFGALVETNVSLGGRQCDLVVTQFAPGFPSVSAYVEVKSTRAGVLRLDKIEPSLFHFHNLLNAGKVDAAVLVSNKPLTKDGQTAFREADRRIKFATTADLQRQLIESDAMVAGFLADYESRPIHLNWIELQLSRPTAATSIDSIFLKGSGRSPSNLAELLASLEERPLALHVLLGDYGTGKTSAMDRLKALACRNSAEGQTESLPLSFVLRNSSRFASIEEFVLQESAHQLGRSVPREAFFQLLQSGRFLMIFDGFDEIAGIGDVARRAKVLLELSPFLFSRSQAVLSSRPSLFESFDGIVSELVKVQGFGAPHETLDNHGSGSTLAKKLLPSFIDPQSAALLPVEFEIMVIKPLNENDIKGYLLAHDERFQRVLRCDWLAVHQFLCNIYDLSELVTRPIILEMFVETLLTGGIRLDAVGNEMSATALYGAYTKLKLQIDYSKHSRQLLSAKMRGNFAQRSAEWMFDNDRSELDRDGFRQVLADMPIPHGGRREAEIMSDLMTCSFLSITPVIGELRFVHKSFAEYFAACSLHDAIEAGQLEVLDTARPWEILYFLGGFAIESRSFRAKLVNGLASSQPDSIRRTNFFQTLMESSRDIQLKTVTGRYKVKRLSKRSFRKTNFQSCQILVNDAIVASFQDCTLGGSIESASSVDVTVFDCRGALEVIAPAGQVVVDDGGNNFKIAGNKLKIALDGRELDLTVLRTKNLAMACKDSIRGMRLDDSDAHLTGNSRSTNIYKSTLLLSTNSSVGDIQMDASTLFVDGAAQISSSLQLNRSFVFVRGVPASKQLLPMAETTDSFVVSMVQLSIRCSVDASRTTVITQGNEALAKNLSIHGFDAIVNQPRGNILMVIKGSTSELLPGRNGHGLFASLTREIILSTFVTKAKFESAVAKFEAFVAKLERVDGSALDPASLHEILTLRSSKLWDLTQGSSGYLPLWARIPSLR